jgi:hypothetical protein
MNLFTKLFFLCALNTVFNLQAQFTHPMLFEVNSPSSIQGSYNYGPQASTGWGITALPSSTVSGQLVWAYDNTPDSLVCDPVTNDYSGKIVMIRRGVCGFSNKILNAQNAGAIGCVICNNQGGTAVMTMSAGTVGAQVTIPAVIISEQDCAIISASLAAGETVVASFRKPSVSAAAGFYQYETPQSQIRPLEGIKVDVLNITNTIANDVIASVNIIDPYGASTLLTDTIPTLSAGVTTTVTFTDSYTPAAIGLYNMTFKSSLNNDSIVRTFKIGSNQFTHDEQVNYTWVTIPSASFTNSNYRFDMGSVYSTGSAPCTAKKATFSLANGDEYLGKVFQLQLYELPTTATGGEQNYSTFNLVGFGADTIDVADTADYTLITKPLFDVNTLADSVQLQPNKKYMLVVSYTGDGSVINPPQYAYSGNQPLLSFGTTVYTDILFMGGFTGSPHAIIRLETSPSQCADSLSLTANNLPVSTGMEIALCQGDSLTLTASGSSNYAWNNGVVSGQPFVPIIEGIYSVTGTDSLGCSTTKEFSIDIIESTSSSIIQTSCDVYTAPDNVVYTNSGQYTAVIPNAAGCDSTITILLTINNSSSNTETVTGLDSYTWTANGQTYTQSGTYTAVIPNSAGCDSTVTLDLTLSFTGLSALTYEFNAYPNPTSDYITIDAFCESVKRYKIVDAIGRSIIQGNLMPGENTIQLNEFARGAYSIIIEEKALPIRIMKE